MTRLAFLVCLLTACLAMPQPQESSQSEQVEEGTTKCGYTTCGANAFCTEINGYQGCKCNDGFYGSGYAGCTSEPECVEHSSCKDDQVCQDNLCTSPCWRSCPADVGCVVTNHRAECIFGGPWFQPPPPPSTPEPSNPTEE